MHPVAVYNFYLIILKWVLRQMRVRADKIICFTIGKFEHSSIKAENLLAYWATAGFSGTVLRGGYFAHLILLHVPFSHIIEDPRFAARFHLPTLL